MIMLPNETSISDWGLCWFEFYLLDLCCVPSSWSLEQLELNSNICLACYMSQPSHTEKKALKPMFADFPGLLAGLAEFARHVIVTWYSLLTDSQAAWYRLASF